MDISSKRWKQKCCCYFLDLLRNHNILGHIYIEQILVNIVSCVIKYSTLLSCGIESIKVINSTEIDYKSNSVVILSHNSEDLFRSLDIPANIKLFFYSKDPSFFVNREYTILDFGFIPIDANILSLEDNESLNIFGINGYNPNQYVVYMLDIFDVFGYPSNIETTGHISTAVANTIINKTRDNVTNINWNSDTEYTEQSFENLIIIDRVCDWDNFFQIGSNYESLLDHIYKIKQSRILIDNNINNTLILSEDVVFPEIKDKNLSDLSNTLSNKIETISKFYSEKDYLQTLSEFRVLCFINTNAQTTTF